MGYRQLMLAFNEMVHALKTYRHTQYMVVKGVMVLKCFTLVYPYIACNQW
jgi:hypothetical protein